MFFWVLDQYGREIKKAAKAQKVERATIRKWLKFYKKVRKNAPFVTNHYHQVRTNAQKILADTRELEQILIQALLDPDEKMTKADGQRMKELLEEFRKTQSKLDFQFLIGKEDKEIHSTISSLINLGPEYIAGNADPLMMQSEVENLIAMICEGIEKEKPDLFELASFYVNHSDADLEELSHSMQLEKVHEVFQEEFLEPILPIVKGMMAKRYATQQEADDAVHNYIHDLCSI